ncbi:MAG: type II CRISPR RNA-guided endonuclease Cas9, partial [Lachnospiraceae bacterium]|nr:type II CRISPR RNA-guided endonuclease Cas9 [Lachnospiraceae bacterium]
METKGEYFLGLDIGTNSVGWAVTNEKYQLLRAKGKDLWGVRLFDEAHTAEERRGFRTARRRRQRETARLGMLRELFSEEIDKIDPGFFARLDDSRFQMPERAEGNKQTYALFASKEYTDQDYYKDYPTIFHLRRELLRSEEPHDIRLVYLALANMFKHRGHFLNTSLRAEEDKYSFRDACQFLADQAQEAGVDFPMIEQAGKLESLLGERGLSRKSMLERVANLTEISKKNKEAYAILKLMCGLEAKLTEIFGREMIEEEHKKVGLSFRAADYDELEEDIRDIIGNDKFEIILAVKDIHDRGLLSNIMKGHRYLSEARVELYEEHQRDLRQLKTVLKRYSLEAYHDMFRIMKDGNYSAYVGSVNSSDKVIRRTGKGRTQEVLYKTIKDTLKKFPQDDLDIIDILSKIEAEAFLPKQLTASNGIIPNQVHEKEMRAILKQAGAYLPFLLERDDSDLTVSERICRIFSFHLPYYVGPIGPENRDRTEYHGWAERKAPGRVYPWNLEEKIDMKVTARKFIERMVRHCTYLTGEHALPRQSLLYEQFEVLNELNNLKIYGEKPSVEIKQSIYRQLFETGKKVSLRQLETYLIVNGYIKKGETDAISGIDGGFHSSLSSLGKFKGILGEAAQYDENRKMIEDIIFWGTVYGRDKSFLKESIYENYGEVLTEKDIKRILGFKFEGWGKLSYTFLNMEGASKEEGVIRKLITSLWETNDNLMQLLSARYTYSEALASMMEAVEKPLSEWVIEDFDGMYLSAPVKRMVWQTMKVLKELEMVLGGTPKKIFVEMAREEGEKGIRKEPRKKKLLELYQAIEDEKSLWIQEIKDKPEQVFRSKKLYLYYRQMGLCMYTGETIDFDDLMNDNLYDIDHIYPRHFVKDDSLENNLVLVKKENNAHKSDIYPIEEKVQRKMHPRWQFLLDKGLISREKFNRLTRRTHFTEEEKAAFISRQLVETRQGTKVVTQILKQAFPASEIVFSKAGNVSDFRNKYKLYKVRCVNDLHHANDAYLNIVVGNVYNVKFTKDPLYFIREAKKYPNKDVYKYNMDKIFSWNVERNGEVAWIVSKREGEDIETIQTVRKVISKNSPLVTRMCSENHGGITRKATIWNAETAKGEGYIPVKQSDSRLQDVTRYGGLTAVAGSGYTLVEYQIKGKKIRSLEQLPVYLGRVDSLTEEVMLAYFHKVICEENEGKEIVDVCICKKFIPYNAFIKYNGFFYYLGGKTGSSIIMRSAVQAVFSCGEMNYIKKIEKAVASKYFEEKEQGGGVILTKEKNQKLYVRIKYKYQNTIFQNKMGKIGSLIINSEERFSQLTLSEQCIVLMEIMKNFNTGDGVDMTLIGGKEKTGITTINKRISKCDECILIHQSAAGLY